MEDSLVKKWARFDMDTTAYIQGYAEEDELFAHNGQRCYVKRLTSEEDTEEERSGMYRVRFADGLEGSVYPDELVNMSEQLFCEQCGEGWLTCELLPDEEESIRNGESCPYCEGCDGEINPYDPYTLENGAGVSDTAYPEPYGYYEEEIAV